MYEKAGRIWVRWGDPQTRVGLTWTETEEGDGRFGKGGLGVHTPMSIIGAVSCLLGIEVSLSCGTVRGHELVSGRGDPPTDERTNL